ncbi:arginine--tRNA ligase [Rhizocola hellebori]|uniref:Arginine--tRNA ligase n=1 Tax=Rhizocola hellebori TaxID=1392758 RepID=A0A8J3Q4L2_9ACTN|nr:arginine--tRNA ligase [Rhizocola hellebori]GIH03334.1 arginine--tRNA ligase [Rhizocola hellebori]
MNIEHALVCVFSAALAEVAGFDVDPAVRRSPRADFQVDGALALARRLGRPPVQVAQEVLDRVDWAGLHATAQVAGPGFINVTLDDRFLAQELHRVATDERLGVAAATPQVVTIDYSAPNVAKEMHVGHLRSTVIGDAAARLLSFLGHQVRRMNHVGDWGTPFGMLIEHLLDIGETEAAHELSVGDLTAFYQAARAKFDSDPGFAQRSRLRVVALQAGDEQTRRLWRLLVEESEKYFLAVYGKLGVTLSDADFLPESFYNDELAPLVKELDEQGLLHDSQGAKCVFPPGFAGRDGEPLPLIVRKSDGGFGYAATDLASVKYRTGPLAADRMLYFVGTPQRLHFEMVFAAARQAGWIGEKVEVRHVNFGSILGEDGKMLKTRAGQTIKLIELLDEAVSRAAAIVADKSPHLEAETQAQVAWAVGIGAIKYADLSSDRVKDYVFDWDRMLATNGDTAAYLQYACARIGSIFRKGAVVPDPAAPVTLAHPAERALAMELLAFPAVLDTAARTVELHRLAGYLFGLAGLYTEFYSHCRVLGSAEQAGRLVLCDVTRRTLVLGLDLLGIVVPERM